jgi:hypothetical protein
MRHNQVRVYRTDKHQITGVSQQQSHTTQLLVFQTQSGTVSEADLEEIQEFD